MEYVICEYTKISVFGTLVLRAKAYYLGHPVYLVVISVLLFNDALRVSMDKRHSFASQQFTSLYAAACSFRFLVHGQVTIIFVVSVGLSVCLSVCLFVCAEFFSAVFDPISIKLGHMLYVWV